MTGASWRYGILGLTPLLPALVVFPAGGWLLPLLAPLTLWFLFAPAVRDRRYGHAFAAALVWATLLSSGVILLTELTPRLAGARIVHAEPYRLEMFAWIETGHGKENEPSRFIPEHLSHLAVFSVLSLLSGGYLGLALGAALLAYMSYFVGSFALSSGQPWLGALVAWVPWSLVRVAAFVALGTVLARPLLVRRWLELGARERRWILLALGGVAVDLVVKVLLAPSYGLYLRTWLTP